MLQVISRRTALQRNLLILTSTRSVKTTVKIPDESEYSKAMPIEKVPGPKSYPLVGMVPHFMPMGKYYKAGIKETNRKMKEEFGNVVVLKGSFGKPDFYFLFDPKDIEIVFRTEGKWPYRQGLELLDVFRSKERPDLFQGIGGLLQDQGAVWQDTRTKVNPVMMQPKTVKSYVPVVQKIADEFVERIRSLRDENMEVPGDFQNEANKWALESIASIALDQRLHLLTNEDPNSDGQRLITVVHDFFSLSYELEMLPSIWKYYKTPAYKKYMTTLHTMTNIITSLIEKSLEDMKTKPEDSSHEESVLEKLIKIDKRVAIIMALDMLMAGVDTTSTATLTILYQLARHPEKQAILREEIMEKLPHKDSQLTAALMANMPYLRAVIKEATRLRPVAIGTARKTTQNLVLSGYAIPEGTGVVMSQMLMSTDEQYFGRSQEFLPERFLKDQKDGDLKGDNPFTFLPFGFGSRMCIGRRFAELEMETLISKIIRNYKIEWHHPEMKYVSKLLYMPSGDLKFRFVDL